MDNKVISSVCYLDCALLDLFGVVKKNVRLSDTRVVLHKIYRGWGVESQTIEQLCSCEFNLESNHIFPIKPVIAVWGGG